MKSLFLALLLALIAGTAHADATGGYISTSSYQIAYLRITQDGSHLDGSLSTVTYDTASSSCKTSDNNLQGSIHGGDLSLRGDSFLGSRTTLFTGAYRGHTVSIDFPQNNGTISTMVFHKGSNTKWNETVVGFEKKMQIVTTWRGLLGDLQASGTQFDNLNKTIKSNGQEMQTLYAKVQPAQDKVDAAKAEVDKATEADGQAQADFKAADQATKDTIGTGQYQSAMDDYQRKLTAQSNTSYALVVAQGHLQTAQSDADQVDQKVKDMEGTLKQETAESKGLYARLVGDIAQLKKVEQQLHIHTSGLWKMSIPAWRNPMEDK